MIIWGNHSPTMYPDIENSIIGIQKGNAVIDDSKWIEDSFLPLVQQRGKQ